MKAEEWQIEAAARAARTHDFVVGSDGRQGLEGGYYRSLHSAQFAKDEEGSLLGDSEEEEDNDPGYFRG